LWHQAPRESFGKDRERSVGLNKVVMFFIAHVVGSFAWFFAVEAVDLAQGGHWRLGREGIQFALSPLLIFVVTFDDIFLSWHRMFLAAGMPTYFCVTWLVYRRLSRRDIAADRWRRGCCPACGYCLAGNVSGVCPECGRIWRK
jgi:hypothetical protein